MLPLLDFHMAYSFISFKEAFIWPLSMQNSNLSSTPNTSALPIYHVAFHSTYQQLARIYIQIETHIYLSSFSTIIQIPEGTNFVLFIAIKYLKQPLAHSKATDKHLLNKWTVRQKARDWQKKCLWAADTI